MIATRTKTYASAALNATAGLKALAATVVAPVALTSADLIGSGILDFPRTVTVTADSSTGAFNNTDPIVVTGRRGGQTVTEELQLTSADGAQTIFGNQPFDVVTAIDIPAQADTDGELSFGLGDICAPAGDKFVAVMVDTAVTTHLNYGGGQVDAIPLAARTRLDVAFDRIATGTGETSGAAVTVFHGQAHV